MRRGCHAMLATTAMCGAIAACSTFGSTDAPPASDAGVDARVDGNPPPGDPDGGGGDAGSDAFCDQPTSGTVLYCDDFESGGCTSWVGNGATIQPDQKAQNSGTHSCRICTTAGSVHRVYIQKTLTPPLPAGSALKVDYYLEDETTDGGMGEVELAVATGTTDFDGGSTPFTLKPKWQIGGLPLSAMSTSSTVQITIDVPTTAATGQCFFVDDVLLRANP